MGRIGCGGWGSVLALCCRVASASCVAAPVGLHVRRVFACALRLRRDARGFGARRALSAAGVQRLACAPRARGRREACSCMRVPGQRHVRARRTCWRRCRRPCCRHCRMRLHPRCLMLPCLICMPPRRYPPTILVAFLSLQADVRPPTWVRMFDARAAECYDHLPLRF